MTTAPQTSTNDATVDAFSYQRSFNRFELKYRLHYEQVEEFLERVGPYVRRDAHSSAEGFYRVVSLYYDSPDLVCFWDKIDGVKFRRKIRVRLYDDSARHAFLEIKQRIDQTVQKRRMRAELGDILRSLDHGGAAEGQEPDPVLDEAIFLRHAFHMEPRVIVSYNRAAFFARYEHGLRITLDRNLRYSRFRGAFDFHSGRDKFFLPPHELVLEVKFNEVIPTWLCSCLNGMDLQAVRISKYCHATNHDAFHGEM